MNDRKKSLIIGLGLIILSAVSLISTVVVISDYRQVTACQAEYNKNYTQAIKDRQAAANDDRTATKSLAQGTVDMLDTVLNPASSVEQRKNAVEGYREINKTYINLTAEAEKKRQENPLPLIPECATKEK